MGHETITAEIVFDVIENAYIIGNHEYVLDSVHDACDDGNKDADVLVEDTGIGHYEYWGAPGFDSCIEVTEVTGSVEITLEYSVTLREGDTDTAAAIAQAMADFEWPVLVIGDVTRGRPQIEYDVQWTPMITPSGVMYKARLME